METEKVYVVLIIFAMSTFIVIGVIKPTGHEKIGPHIQENKPHYVQYTAPVSYISGTTTPVAGYYYI